MVLFERKGDRELNFFSLEDRDEGPLRPRHVGEAQAAVVREREVRVLAEPAEDPELAGVVDLEFREAPKVRTCGPSGDPENSSRNSLISAPER